MLTIDDVRNMNLVAYEYVRGSMLYGTNVEGSDEDHGGVYIAPIDNVLGFDSYYDAQVSDEKHDNTYYEIKRWLELLCQSNPNALESLFVPENKIIGDIHPAIKLIRDNANLFLTKQCFKSFYGYASEQIKRARGLNKKMVNPVHEKKGVLDFCYVPHCQGSICITDWLKRYGLKQEYCGLVNIPNMHNMYAVFYDWGAHFTELDLYDKVNDFMFDEVFNKLFPDYYELIGDIFDDRYQRDGRFFKKYAKTLKLEVIKSVERKKVIKGGRKAMLILHPLEKCTMRLSVKVVFKNFFLAGTLKNRSLIVNVVPGGHPAGTASFL